MDKEATTKTEGAYCGSRKTHREMASSGWHPQISASGVEDNLERTLRRRSNCDLAIVLRVQVIPHLHIHSRHPPRPSLLLLLLPQTQNPLPQRHSVQTPIHPRHCYHNKNCKHPKKKQLTRRHRCDQTDNRSSWTPPPPPPLLLNKRRQAMIQSFPVPGRDLEPADTYHLLPARHVPAVEGTTYLSGTHLGVG